MNHGRGRRTGNLMNMVDSLVEAPVEATVEAMVEAPIETMQYDRGIDQ